MRITGRGTPGRSCGLGVASTSGGGATFSSAGGGWSLISGSVTEIEGGAGGCVTIRVALPSSANAAAASAELTSVARTMCFRATPSSSGAP